MARPAKRGIDYAGWDVGLFDNDEKIIRLLAAQGWLGFSVFFYICQKAYATEGYYYQWSDASPDIIAYKMGGGIRPETVDQTVKTCLRLGLFDDRLFVEGVLTGRCIQRRYAEAIKKRDDRTVRKDYWLFEEDEKESKGLTFITPKGNSRPGNAAQASFRGENPGFLPGNDTKESKSNEIKIDEEEDARARENPFDIPLDPDWVKFVQLYEQNIGLMPNGFALEELQSFYDDFGIDVIEVAIRATAQKHAYNPKKYLDKILRGWLTSGVRTVDQAKASVAEHERAMQAQNAPRRGRQKQEPPAQPTGPQLKPGVNPFD